LFGTRMKAGRAVLVAVAVGTLASLSPAAASPPNCHSSSGGIGTSGSKCRSSGYVNPFAGQSWGPGRIDMGVDLAPLRREPVNAIGDAKILGSDSHSGWPAGHFIWYRLLNGDHAGNIVYVAEHLTKMVPAGTVVHTGQRIATALPGSPWTEWGWATKSGSTRAAPCYHEGMVTNSGREMARFLRSLGAKFIDRPPPGPNRPAGNLC
jgi:murein DD-endopeptidase MepM/ murein hydrolase activator NlpD